MKSAKQRAAMQWIYATPAQESYIRRLRSEVAQYRTAKWATITRRMLKSEASTEIEMLLAAIREGKASRTTDETPNETRFSGDIENERLEFIARVGATEGEFLNAMAGR